MSSRTWWTFSRPPLVGGIISQVDLSWLEILSRRDWAVVTVPGRAGSCVGRHVPADVSRTAQPLAWLFFALAVSGRSRSGPGRDRQGPDPLRQRAEQPMGQMALRQQEAVGARERDGLRQKFVGAPQRRLTVASMVAGGIGPRRGVVRGWH
jgi:hypothetical protein